MREVLNDNELKKRREPLVLRKGAGQEKGGHASVDFTIPPMSTIRSDTTVKRTKQPHNRKRNDKMNVRVVQELDYSCLLSSFGSSVEEKGTKICT